MPFHYSLRTQTTQRTQNRRGSTTNPTLVSSGDRDYANSLADSDAEYMQMIQKYQGSPYYQQLVDNPWLVKNNGEFSPNFLQMLGEAAFGDTSARDAYYSNLKNQRNQYLADKLAQMNEYELNKPSNQVALERSAGLNPDLVGLSAAQPAPGNDQPNVPFEANNGDGAFQNVMSLGTSIVGSAFSFYQSLQNIRSVDLDNSMKEFSMNNALREFAWQVIKEGTSQFINNEFDKAPNGTSADIEGVIKNGKLITPIVQSFQNRINNMPFSKRQKKALSGLFNDLVYSTNSDGVYSFSAKYEKMVNDTISELFQSRNNYAKSAALPFSQVGNHQVIRFMNDEIYKPLADLQIQVDKAMLTKNKAQYNYETNYYNTASGAVRGNAENVKYNLQSSLGDVKLRVTRAFEEINKRITGSKDLPDIWKISLSAGVASVEGMLYSKIFAF